MAGTHDFGHHRKPRALSGEREQLERFLPEPSKGIRRSARFESAAAQHAGSPLAHVPCDLKQNFTALHGARTGDHHDPPAAKLRAANPYDRSAAHERPGS